MEAVLKEKLNYTTCKSFGGAGGGCISQGVGYNTNKEQIYVKCNTKAKARQMFEGEYASLNALLATDAIRCPRPIEVLDVPGKGCVLVMEYLDMTSLQSHAANLGQQLANMHLHNSRLKSQIERKAGSVNRDKDLKFVDKFGFDVVTCCGYLPQDNTWMSDWLEFYSRRLQQQITWTEQNYGDREAVHLWSELQRKIPQLFKGLEIVPALLHGDLWSGNVSQNEEGPLIFDAASFYGHHEYDLGIASLFGGFSRSFWSAYHNVIAKDPGWDKRNLLYQLFHYLNHWNHFGSGYRSSSISLMKKLCV